VTSIAIPTDHLHLAPPPRWRGVALFAVLTVLYFTIGAVLMLRYNIFEGDGMSRVANASFTLMSRDPHLSAIGFVWNPLPGLVEIPILELSGLWPELRTRGLAGALQSALFMAAAALFVRRIALDRGVSDLWRRAAVACFALNPVIIAYGGSGMSEAGMLLSLLWCTRHLLRWVDSARVSDLAWAGIALGVGYLVRYEMIPAAAGAVGLVTVITLMRSDGRARINTAILSALIVTFPIAVAFIVWALAGWIVDGELLAQLGSRYGNAAQIELARASGHTSAHGWETIARLLAMQPLIGFAVVAAAALSLLRRKADALVPLATFGSVLAFSVWGQQSGATFAFVRYYVAAIPLVIVIALVFWQPTPIHTPEWILNLPYHRLGAAFVCASLFTAIPVTGRSMLNPELGNHQLLLGIGSLLEKRTGPTDDDWYRRVLVDDRLLIDYLDRKNLPAGSVLTDTFTTWGLFQASKNPRQFVITSDYDFGAKLNRPWELGVKYIVVTQSGNAPLDAINLRYPTLWDDGAGISKLIHSGRGAFGQEQYRIYRVLKPIDDKLPAPG